MNRAPSPSANFASRASRTRLERRGGENVAVVPSTDMRGAAAASSSAASTPHASRMPEWLFLYVIVAASDVLDRDVRKETAGCLAEANASEAELDVREEADESGFRVSAKPAKPPSKPPPRRARSAVVS